MKKIVVFFFLLVLTFALSSALEAAWNTKRLTNNTGASGAEGTAIAVEGSNIYVAWSDQTPGNNEIYFRKSTDSGSSWQASKRLTYNTGSSWWPSIAVYGTSIYVVWMDDTSGNKEIYFRKSADDGATWQSQKRLTSNSGESWNPKIVENGNAIFIVWTDNTPGNYEIYFIKSIDGGATWQSAKKLTNTAGDSFRPSIANSGSKLCIVWYDITPGNREIYFRKSTDGGDTWQTTKRLTNNAGESRYPKIALDSSNIYAVWQDSTPGNYEIYFRKSADDGATWQPAKRITNDSGDSEYPDIAVHGQHVYLTWDDNTTGNREVYFKNSLDGGAAWQPLQQLTNTAGDSLSTQIAEDDPSIYIVYSDQTPGNFEVYTKMYW